MAAGVQAAMAYHDQLYLAPLARRPPRKKRPPPEIEDHGVGRSPHFAPGWWLAGVVLFYSAVALLCILVL